MAIKHVAVSAAMATFAGIMISSAGPAQADPVKYKHVCSFDLGAPDGTQDGPIDVHGDFTTSTCPAGSGLSYYVGDW